MPLPGACRPNDGMRRGRLGHARPLASLRSDGRVGKERKLPVLSGFATESLPDRMPKRTQRSIATGTILRL